ncbi:hypothetical protein FACS1894159_04550 [Bacteroidia bacterium]|nr:hypothetical protein FACS1894159_04550 [Bacteroidia bacterium]
MRFYAPVCHDDLRRTWEVDNAGLTVKSVDETAGVLTELVFIFDELKFANTP